MAETKTASEAASKYARVTPDRAPDYEAGIKNPKRDWQKNTKASESNYEDGVQGAIKRKAFGKGVEKAGNEKWQRKSIATGVPNYGPGVQAAEQDYLSGVSPYIAEIERTTLPPRYPKGDPRNYKRSEAIGTALHKKKISG